MKTRFLLTLLGTVLFTQACGRMESKIDVEDQRSEISAEESYRFDPNNPDYSFSSEHGYDFRKGPLSSAGLVAKAHKDKIRACVSSNAFSEARKSIITSSIQKWMAAIQETTSLPVVQTVEILAWDSPSCDVYVSYGNYNPAHTYMGKTPRVNIATSGWFGSSTVILHEFGHAFGLLDTYYGRGGGCQSGQPASVMCYAKYNELKQDDKLGVQSIYQSLFAQQPVLEE